MVDESYFSDIRELRTSQDVDGLNKLEGNEYGRLGYWLGDIGEI